MKLTAVELLIDELKSLGIYSSTLKQKCDRAKEMEKQQIIDACIEFGMHGKDLNLERAKEYYNNTFKNGN